MLTICHNCLNRRVAAHVAHAGALGTTEHGTTLAVLAPANPAGRIALHPSSENSTEQGAALSPLYSMTSSASQLPAQVAGVLDDFRDRPVYGRVPSPSHGILLRLIEGREVAFEGAPGAGKTTAMHSVVAALTALGAQVEAHEEERDDELLNEFARDPKQNAFWFQMIKLLKRRTLCDTLDARDRNDRRVHIIDRTLPGDMAFALFNYAKGNISEAQFRIYMNHLTQLTYRPPFLVVYLALSPERSVERIAARGYAWEKELYTVEYFRLMDVCYRTALSMAGCNYCVVPWEENHPGVTAHHAAETRPLIATDVCVNLLNAALCDSYGPNLEHLGRAASNNATTVPAHGINDYLLAQMVKEGVADIAGLRNVLKKGAAI